MDGRLWLEVVKYLLTAFGLPVLSSIFFLIKSALAPTRKQSEIRGFTLQVSETATDVAISSSGRVPLELNSRSWGPTNFVFYCCYRFLLDIPYLLCLRPSSRKNAFAAENIKITENSDLVSTDGRLSPGGIRIVLWLAKTEDMEHLCRSMRHIMIKRAFLFGSRTLAIVGPDFLSDTSQKVELVRVSVDKINLEEITGNKIILRSTRTAFGPGEKKRVIDRSEVPPNVIWIFNTKSNHSIQVLTNKEGRKQYREKRYRTTSLMAIFSEPPLCSDPPGQRFFRNVLLIYLGIATTLIWGSSTDFDFGFAKLSSVEAYFLVIHTLIYVVILLSHFIRYWQLERGKASWAGGTSGCFADGSFIRDG